MRGNKGKDTKPELLVRRLLREAGYSGYRLHWKKAPGRPDIAYPGRKVAVFVNGCYWHRCPKCSPPMPKAHRDYWSAKFAANQARDAANVSGLRAAGWTVVVLWECEVKAGPKGEMGRLLDLLRCADPARQGPRLRVTAMP
jgi:DNA mismatch endonuclease (patch repair protein)